MKKPVDRTIKEELVALRTEIDALISKLSAEVAALPIETDDVLNPANFSFRAAHILQQGASPKGYSPQPILTYSQLANFTAGEILSWPDCGTLSLNEIRVVLARRNLRLKYEPFCANWILKTTPLPSRAKEGRGFRPKKKKRKLSFSQKLSMKLCGRQK